MIRHVTLPVQQVHVEVIQPEPLQARLAGSHCPFAASVHWQHLGHDAQRFAPVRAERLQCPADQPLGFAVGIHFGGIDHAHAALERMQDGTNLSSGMRPILADAPGAEAHGLLPENGKRAHRCLHSQNHHSACKDMPK